MRCFEQTHNTPTLIEIDNDQISQVASGKPYRETKEFVSNTLLTFWYIRTET